MASIAAAVNQTMLVWPRGTTMKAASSGPNADPALPPTWNRDCASPCRPPEAIRATRDDSGWNTEDPTPTSAAATRIVWKLPARASTTRPTRVKPIASGNE